MIAYGFGYVLPVIDGVRLVGIHDDLSQTQVHVGYALSPQL